MEPNAFVAEVYHRMSVRHPASTSPIHFETMRRDLVTRAAVYQYANLLPKNKDTAILDIGFGRGWFMAACVEMGYTNISGADFGANHKQYLLNWSPSICAIYDVETTIGDLLGQMPEQFDFIHMAHVIEHIPKHSLLYLGDALYLALKKGGGLIVRTPNMEGPRALSSYYVTLGHEYGFAGSNLVSLLDICGFEDVQFVQFPFYPRRITSMIGRGVRMVFEKWNAMQHRLFGVNRGGQFGQELVVTAKRGNQRPLFDEKFK